ncbi:hypothetical protein LEMLEM_LOCUS4910 [Lemmus lemmus]
MYAMVQGLKNTDLGKEPQPAKSKWPEMKRERHDTSREMRTTIGGPNQESLNCESPAGSNRNEVVFPGDRRVK